MNDTEIHKIITERLDKAQKNCPALVTVDIKLAEIILLQKAGIREQEKLKAETNINSDRLLIIETRGKVAYGIYVALLVAGGIVTWIIDKLLAIFDK